MNEVELDAFLTIANALAPLPEASQVRVLELFLVGFARSTLEHVRFIFAELQQQTRTGGVDRREALAFLEILEDLMEQFP